MSAGARRKAACELLGLAARTLERWVDHGDDGRHGPNTEPANKLSDAERRKIIALGMAFAGDGTLYVSTDNDPQGGHSPMSGTLWKIDIHAKSATPIAASIGRPRGIAVLPTGQIVATDYMHQVLQLVDPSTGKVQPLAGAWDEAGCIDALGGAARFATPYGVVVVNGQNRGRRPWQSPASQGRARRQRLDARR